MITRPRKVEVIVLGRGLAAAALALLLAQRGRRVALLVEEPGWDSATYPAWQGWHHAKEQRVRAAAGAALLAQWQTAAMPGIAAHPTDAGPLWRLDYAALLPALGQRIEQLGEPEEGTRADRRSTWIAQATRVRGISVIENAILGAIAEDARYDARAVVNAAEDARYSAFARMMRQPASLDLRPVTPDLPPDTPATWPAAAALRDHAALEVGATPVVGAWQLRGIAGWPLLALGAALRLAEQLDS